MKALILATLAAVSLAAGATGQPKNLPHSGDKTATASSAATATSASTSSASTGPIDLSLMANPVASGGNLNQGNTYVFPAPAAAAPLPTGVCPKGDSEAWSVVWGFVSYSRSSTRTEMECLEKLIAYGKETAPKPAQSVVNYIAPPVRPEPPAQVSVCPPPPKKAAVKRAAKQCKPA